MNFKLLLIDLLKIQSIIKVSF